MSVSVLQGPEHFDVSETPVEPRILASDHADVTTAADRIHARI